MGMVVETRVPKCYVCEQADGLHGVAVESGWAQVCGACLREWCVMDEGVGGMLEREKTEPQMDTDTHG